ncbi:MAG: succinate dehydrogenase, hydrophobic membrane anchor protein [Zetaproteobacteria bacterium]|nr:MAG: succinate dehydrogenase, hydrophobic membrane anchor protein [Zetaproteobacteria bacterium]
MSGHKNNKFVAPLKIAKNHGSAHEGTEHWLQQKITALAQIPLVLWLIWSIIGLQGASYAEFTAWMGQPVNAILMIILISSVMLHAKLGAQVVVEDYISTEWFKMAKLIGGKIFFYGLSVACIFSVLKIAFTAGI